MSSATLILLAAISRSALTADSGSCSADSGNCAAQSLLDELESELQQIVDSAVANQRSPEAVRGSVLKDVLTSITGSSVFQEKIWLRQPVRTRLGSEVLGSAMFNMTDATALVERGLVRDGVINGFMLEGVKSGEVRSFQFDASQGRSLLTKKEVQAATKKSTWLISQAHTLHEGIANATLDFQRVFGFPASTNVYITRSNFGNSAPVHTDRQDSFIIQTSGAKKWTIYSPPVLLPVWGVHSEAQWGKAGGYLPAAECGPVLYQGVLAAGDMLYLPRGFPHHTSTSLDAKEKASVSLTVAVITDSWNLVNEKLVRCALGVAGLCSSPPPVACPVGPALTRYTRTSDARLLRSPLPLGFLAPAAINMSGWLDQTVDMLQPHLNRFIDEAVADGTLGKYWVDDESRPANVALAEGIRKIARIFWDELPTALTTLEESFAGQNDRVAFRDRQAHWDEVFRERAHPLGDLSACHPEGGMPIFSDYPNFNRAGEEDDFTRKLRILAR